MLFNSLGYIFAFLPAVLLGWWGLARYDRRLALGGLALASLFFYGWWDWRYLALLGGSIVFNYGAAHVIHHAGPRRKLVLGLAIAVDLAVLGWFKYADFLGTSLAALIGWHWTPLGVPLPLGISFFTFTQIAFLVDTARGKAREADPVNYTLFVTFFPHLLAGPVLHHSEMMPQFADPLAGRPKPEMVASGLTLFIIGLFKKTVLADGIAPVATLVFDAATRGILPGTAEAWAAALAYTFELDFDFSGYTDMALGSARVFGIVLPLNFDSPYQSTSIIEFWRRWHMTLSRFLRDYLYIPLGGNRLGAVRRHANLLATMLLGGLWHGAAWTFVAWGAWHGVLLVLNHLWRGMVERFGLGGFAGSAPVRVFGWALTFFLVMIGWVVFRAEGFDTAARIFSAMAGQKSGFAAFTPGLEIWVDLAVLGAIAALAPNSQTILAEGRGWWRWRPQVAWAGAMALAFLLALGQMSDVSPFLYYRF